MGKKDLVLMVEFEGDDPDQMLWKAAGQLSLSGAQEKFPAVEDHSCLRLPRPGERSTFILKPAPWDHSLQNRRMVPVNEYLTMQIASKIFGIETAENYLCLSPKQLPVYVVRRFDIGKDGKRYQMEDFASVLGRTGEGDKSMYKYDGSYLEIAEAIRKYVPVWRLDMEKFFKMLVFNYIFSNGDAHLKNFSLITKDGERRLAPAYDLLNTSLHLNGDDFALSSALGTMHSDCCDKTGHVCREDFEIFARAVGIPEVRCKAILNMFSNMPSDLEDMISSSLLPPKLKRMYKRSVIERVARFNRETP